jgi:predicted component of type VI protein secretion system
LRLDLDELAGLSAWRQCDRILTAVLGDATHPDDAVLRKAAAEQLKAILSADVPPDSLQAILDFVARYVVDLGLVEIKAQLRVGLPDGEVVAKERDLRVMVRERIRSLRPRLAAVEGGVSVRALKETAARVAREALAMLRAGGQPA